MVNFPCMKTVSSSIVLSPQSLKKGVVVLDMSEYEELCQAAVPTYHLTGKAAEALDREVEEALREEQEGKTIEASSVREALAKYDDQENNKN